MSQVQGICSTIQLKISVEQLLPTLSTINLGYTDFGRDPAERAGWGCTTDQHPQAVPAKAKYTTGTEVSVLWQMTRKFKAHNRVN